MDRLLAAYTPFDDDEAADVAAMRELIGGGGHCYWRTHFDPGHMTGSGLLFSHDGSRVLLNHHKFLDMWIGFGGHADGEQDMLSVCRREIIEESGIEDIEPVTADIADISIHPVPPNLKKQEPAHLHFDVRYLFRLRNNASEHYRISEESRSMRWCSYEEAMALVPANDKISRLLWKWKTMR